MSCELNLYQMSCVFQYNEMLEDEYVFPEDITGWKIELEFKPSFKAKTYFKFSTEDNTITITDAPAGKALRIGKQITVEPGNYYADLTITKPLGLPETWIRQEVEIKKTYQTQ